LRSFCGKSAEETVCIATSATIADRKSRSSHTLRIEILWRSEGHSAVVYEDYELELWRPSARRAGAAGQPGASASQCAGAIGNVDSDPPASLKLLKGRSSR